MTLGTMAEEMADSYSDEEYLELLGFLSDPKLEVQRFAAEGVLAQTDGKAFLEFCQRFPRKAAKPLLRLAEKAEADAATSSAAAKIAEGAARTPEERKASRMAAAEALAASAAGSDSLQALVNISAIPSVRDELLRLSAARRCCEAMRGGWLEGRSGLAHWYSMLLANLSTCEAGQEAICADEHALKFLFAAYITNPRPEPRDGYEDPLIFLGRVIGNACALEAGRRMLAGGDEGPGTLSRLVDELSDRGRRPDVVNALRNLCLDEDHLEALVQSGIFQAMSKFLYPWKSTSEEERSELPEVMRKGLEQCGAALTGEASVRHSAAVCLLGLCRKRAGRELLRDEGCEAVINAWRREEPEEENRVALDTVLPWLTNTEEELEAAQGVQGQPSPDTQQAGISSDASAAAGDADAHPSVRPPAEEVSAEEAVPAAPDAGPADADAGPTGVHRVCQGPMPKRDEGADGVDMAGLFAGIEGVED